MGGRYERQYKAAKMLLEKGAWPVEHTLYEIKMARHLDPVRPRL